MNAISRGAMNPSPGEAPIDVVDRLPREVRALVHEYGYSVVYEFVAKGITKPATIRHLMTAITRGAGEPGNERADAPQASRALNAFGRALAQNGVAVPPQRIVRTLRALGYTLIANAPTRNMVDASMATVANHDVVVTKPEKHFRRLQAALAVADRDLWEVPDVDR